MGSAADPVIHFYPFFLCKLNGKLQTDTINLGAYVSVGVGNVNSAILGYGIRSNGSATISGYYIASVGTNLAGPLLTLPSKFAPKQTIAVMYLCDNGDGKSGYLNTQGQLYIDGMTINNKYRFNFTYPV